MIKITKLPFHAAAIRMEGQLSVFDSRDKNSPCYNCLYKEGDEQNVISRFLKGISVEDMFFVGVLEQYDQSVEEFKQLLGITKKVDIPWENDNSEYKSAYKVSDEVREIITRLNHEDIKLYKNILKFKGIA